MSDSFVRCDDCGAKAELNFSDGLRSGWPKCYCRDPKYGRTMRLVRTNADVGAATTAVLREQTP